MRAIIPVAGVGSRLKPHTHTLPKVLLNVGDKPILGHIISKLLDSGINKATFITGYLGDKIIEYVSSSFPELDAVYVEQESLDGLGHAIYTAAPTFDDEEIFIILGDTIFDVDLNAFFDSDTNVLGLKEVENPTRFGVAIVEGRRIKKLVEKPRVPPSKLAIVGLYYFKNAQSLVKALNTLVEKNIRTQGELQLTDALQLMLDAGEQFSPYLIEGWYDCGKPETLLSTNQYLLSVRSSHPKIETCVINEPVYIDETAEVKNCVLGPYTTIGANCKVTDSIIRNTIVAPGANVEKCLFDNSIIGTNSVIKGKYTRMNTGDSSEIDIN